MPNPQQHLRQGVKLSRRASTNKERRTNRNDISESRRTITLIGVAALRTSINTWAELSVLCRARSLSANFNLTLKLTERGRT